MKDVKYKYTGVRSSRFRYISGKVLHPSNNYDHLKDLSLKMSGECDVLAVIFFIILFIILFSFSSEDSQ